MFVLKDLFCSWNTLLHPFGNNSLWFLVRLSSRKGDVLQCWQAIAETCACAIQSPTYLSHDFFLQLPPSCAFFGKSGGLFSEVVLHQRGLSVRGLASGPTRNQAKPRKRKHWSPPRRSCRHQIISLFQTTIKVHPNCIYLYIFLMSFLSRTFRCISFFGS